MKDQPLSNTQITAGEEAIITLSSVLGMPEDEIVSILKSGTKFQFNRVTDKQIYFLEEIEATFGTY